MIGHEETSQHPQVDIDVGDEGIRDRGREPDPDRHPWRAAILITLALVAGTLLWTMIVNPAIKHARFWIIAADAWPPLTTARYVSAGAYPYLYQADGTWVAGPLLPVLLAPMAALQDSLALTSRTLAGYGFRIGEGTVAVANVPFPAVWPLYSTYTMVLGGLMLVAVRRTVRTILAASAREPDSLLPAVTQVLVAVLGLSITIGYWMHAEDVLGLAMLLFGFRAMWKGRWTAAAVLASLAVGFKQWMVLPALLMVARVPRSDRTKAFLVGVGTSGVIYGIPLLAAPRATMKALFGARSTPWLGHAAPWIADPSARRFVAATPGRVVWFAIAIALAWLVRRCEEPEVILASAALILAARMGTESVVFSYYLFGVITFTALLDVVQRRSVLRSAITGAAALAWFWVPPPRAWWWFVELALVTAQVWPAARTVLRALRQDERMATEARSIASEAAVSTSQELAIPSRTA